MFPVTAPQAPSDDIPGDLSESSPPECTSQQYSQDRQRSHQCVRIHASRLGVTLLAWAQLIISNQWMNKGSGNACGSSKWDIRTFWVSPTKQIDLDGHRFEKHCFVFCFCFWDRVSLRSSGCPRTHYVTRLAYISEIHCFQDQVCYHSLLVCETPMKGLKWFSWKQT